MGKTLVIAEKPSVGRDYAKALSGRFTDHRDYLESDDTIVSWAVGHLVELADPDEYDERYRLWSLKTLPIIPEHFELRPIDGRGKKQLDVLRKLLARKDVDAIVNGCDAGREGELIFARLIEFTGSTKPVQRLWVSSMTTEAIREGFSRLRSGEEMAPLEDAARSRAEADWLVGMNGTRAATKAGRLDGVVSLGRVQTPTLALIVRRDLEIAAFVPETYFQVDGHFRLEGDRTYRGRWFEGKADRAPERERAEAVAAAASGRPSTVESVKRRQRTQRPPLLFDLTSLQREANRRFGISAQRTLQAAQRLYEGSTNGAVITYPRTRSQFLPRDQVPALKPAARSLAAVDAYRPHAEYVAGLDVLPIARVVNDAKVDDHHAIIPTGELPRGRLDGDDARIYDLICRRFLAVFHPDAKFEDTEVITEAGGHRFRTRGERLVEAGWRAPAFGDEPEPAADGDQAADDDSDQALPRIDEGERGTCDRAEVLEKQTKPPGRYTESSLLGAMETAGRTIDDEELREAMKESGLGTPATRADTIERLIAVGYIERERGKSLVSTAKGRGTIGLLGDHALTSAELTGRWEKRLSEIERGDADRAAFMADIETFTGGVVDYFRGLREQTLGACPNGDGEIRENRAAFGCTSYQSKSEPGCGFTIWKRQQGYTIEREQVATLLRDGRVELGGDPPATLVIGEGNEPRIVGADGAPVEDRRAIGPCPNGDGEIRENRAAFGCSSWKSKTEPGCGFTIWKSQRGFTVTAEQVRELLETGTAELSGPQPAKLVLADGNQPQIVGEDGAPLARTARASREPIATCPKCGGEIRENSRAFGCSSWKSKKNPGCGFVIWKSTKGREITADDAKTVIEQGHTPWLDFRDRAGPFRGRLVLQDDRTVGIEREDEGQGVQAA
jgi:DNA topoisomerase-3